MWIWDRITSWWRTKSLDEKVADVIHSVETTCRFVPEAGAVAAMLTAGNPAVIGVAAVAKAICDSVTYHRVALYTNDGWGEVNGVKIEGYFK